MAATALLDRGWGRPSQTLEVAGEVEVQDRRALIDDIVNHFMSPARGGSLQEEESRMPAIAAPGRSEEDRRTRWGS